MNKTLNTVNAPAAIGPYAQGIQAGNMVFVSGQLPIVPATGELVTGSVGEMTCQSMKNIAAILAEAGCTLQDVVKTTIFLKDLGDFAEVNAAYAAGLGSCWIHRPQQMFELPEGKEMLAKWGLPEDSMGIGSIALGYADMELPEASPRKEGYYRIIK